MHLHTKNHQKADFKNKKVLRLNLYILYKLTTSIALIRPTAKINLDDDRYE